MIYLLFFVEDYFQSLTILTFLKNCHFSQLSVNFAAQTTQKDSAMFWLLHIAAFIFFMPALFVTIPLHLIYAKRKVAK